VILAQFGFKMCSQRKITKNQ